MRNVAIVMVLFSLTACVSDTTTSDAGADASTSDATVDHATVDAGTDVTSNDAVAEAETGPSWTPASLTGLVLWLDAAKGVTLLSGGVTTWADQSGALNNAVQATAANQPSVLANTINNLPVIHFDNAATDGGIADEFLSVPPTASLKLAMADFLIMEVVSYTNPATTNENTGYGALLVLSPASALFANDSRVPNASISAQFDYGTYIDTTATTYDNGAPHYVGMRRRGTTLEVRADGTSKTTTLVSTDDFTANTIGYFIGGRILTENANQALNGNIAEVIVVAATVTDPELAQVEGYLTAKYGL